MSHSAQQQRYAVLGLVIAVFAPLGVRAAKEFGWMPSRSAAIVFAIAVGLFCILGAVIAYRATQAQVRLDLDDMKNAGKFKH